MTRTCKATAVLLILFSGCKETGERESPVDSGTSPRSDAETLCNEGQRLVQGVCVDNGLCGSGCADGGSCALGCSEHGQCTDAGCVCDEGYAGVGCADCAIGWVRDGAACRAYVPCEQDPCSPGEAECSAGKRRECVVGADDCASWDSWEECGTESCYCPWPSDPKVTVQQWGAGSTVNQATGVGFTSNGTLVITGSVSTSTTMSNAAAYVSVRSSPTPWGEQWGERSSSGHDVLVSPNDELFVAGDFRGVLNGARLRSPAGTLTKWNANRQRVWEVYWASWSETVWSVAHHSSGDLFVVGETGGDLAAVNTGMLDAFLSRVSAQGVVVWTQQWGTNFLDGAYDIAIDDSGNLYVVGGLGDEAFCRKVTPDGTELWTTTWASPAYDAAWSVAIVDGGESVVVAGLAQGLVEGPGSTGAFVSRVGADGVKRWTKYFSAPGAPYDAAKEVAVTPDHKILIAGETGGEVVVGAHKGSRDAFVQSRSLDGDVLWTKQFGSVGSEMVLGLSVSAAGTAYVVGRTSGEFEGFATTRGTSSFLIRIEP